MYLHDQSQAGIYQLPPVFGKVPEKSLGSELLNVVVSTLYLPL